MASRSRLVVNAPVVRPLAASPGSARSGPTRCVVVSNNPRAFRGVSTRRCPSTADDQGKKKSAFSFPVQIYTLPGGLRQDRGRAAQSTVRGQNSSDESGELME